MAKENDSTTAVLEAEQPYWLVEANYTAEQRTQLAKRGAAMPDGSYPTDTLSALDDAVQSWGRAPKAKRAALKTYLTKRAKALKAPQETLDKISNLQEAVGDQQDSLDEQMENIRSAWADFCQSLAAANPWTSAGYSSWPVEIYTDHIIVRAGDDFWSIPFVMGDPDGDGENDDPIFDVESATKVDRQWVAIEAAIGDDDTQWILRPLTESDGTEPDGSAWVVQIIKAGTSKNRRKYPPSTLQEAAPLFEGVRTLARSDEDHLQQQNKSVEKIVGWLSEAKYSPTSKAITATWNVTAQWLKDMLLEAWKKGKRDLVGLSIVAAGKTKAVRENGNPLIEVEAITKVSSVDVVFDPAAGGGLVKLVAAEDPHTGQEGKEEAQMDLTQLTLEELQQARPDLVDSLKEAAPAVTEPEGEAGVKPTEPITEAEPEDQVPANLSRFVVKEQLSETTLPAPVQERIKKRFIGKAFAETELTEAIQDEVDTFAELEKQGLVASPGRTRDEQIQVTLDEAERARAAMDGFFLGRDVKVGEERVPRYRSLRKMYVDLTGDERITGQLSECVGGKLGISEENGGHVKLHRIQLPGSWDDLREAEGEVELREAISSTTFDQAFGDSITRALLKLYTELNLMIWGPLVDIVPLNDFRTQRRIRLGGYGNMPIVAENGPYTALTSPNDEEAVYAPAKRGGLETVSLEAIMNDDVRVVSTIPRRLARSFAQTLHEFIFDFMRTNAVIYDSTALFTSGHANLGSTALSYTSMRDARVRMRKQADMSNSKRLGLLAQHLWVPMDLEEMAIQLTMPEGKPGTTDNDVNAIRRWGMDYAVVDYWTDPNDWFATADKSQAGGTIELGFVFGETPEILVADQPTQGALFTNDQIRYKGRHAYGAAVVDFRPFDGSLVA